MKLDTFISQFHIDDELSTLFLNNVHKQYHLFCCQHYQKPVSFLLIASCEYLHVLERAMANTKTVIRLVDEGIFANTCGALRFYLGAETTVRIVAINDKSVEPVIVFGTATKVE